MAALKVKPVEPEAPVAAKKRTLPPMNLKNLETSVRQFEARIPTGHTKADLEVPSYWCHRARQFTVNSMIILNAEDRSFWGIGVVTACEDTWAKVWVTVWVEQEKVEERDLLNDYKIDSNANGWRVIEKETGQVLKEGLSSRKDALLHIADLMKASAG